MQLCRTGLCICGPRVLEAERPRTDCVQADDECSLPCGQQLQPQAGGNAEPLATPRNSPNVLFCPAGTGTRQHRGGEASKRARAAAKCWGRAAESPQHIANLGEERKSPRSCLLRAGETKEISTGIGVSVKSDSHFEWIKLLFSPVRWDCGSRIQV